MNIEDVDVKKVKQELKLHQDSNFNPIVEISEQAFTILENSKNISKIEISLDKSIEYLKNPPSAPFIEYKGTHYELSTAIISKLKEKEIKAKEHSYYDEVFVLKYDKFKELIMSYIRTGDTTLRHLIYEALPDYRKDMGYKNSDYNDFFERINAFASTLRYAYAGIEKLSGEQREAAEKEYAKTINGLENSVSTKLKQSIERALRIKKEEENK